MKTLKDGTQVSARTYYYLLDFNERYNLEPMAHFFNKNRLCDLTIEEYTKFFEHATDIDKVSLNAI